MAEDNPTKEHLFWSEENTSDRDTTVVFKTYENTGMTWLAIPKRLFPRFSWEEIISFFALYLREASDDSYWYCKNAEKDGDDYTAFVLKQGEEPSLSSSYTDAYELFCKFNESSVVKQQKEKGRSAQQLEEIINDLESLGRMVENFRDIACIKEAVDLLRRAYS